MNRMIKRLLAAVLITSMLLGSNGISYAAEIADGDSIAGTEEVTQEAVDEEQVESPGDAEASEPANEESAEEEQIQEEAGEGQEADAQTVEEAGAEASEEENTAAEEEISEAASEEEAVESEDEDAAVTEEAAAAEDAEAPENADAAAAELTAEEAAAAAAQAQEEVFTAGELVYHGADYDVTLAYDENAKIPATAELKVREIEKGTSEYESYLAGAEAAAGKGVAEARFFDITIVAAGTDGQQQEIQPQSQVRVNITYHKALEVAAEGEVQAMHFEDGTADAEVVNTDTNGGSEVSEIAFDAESFSVYGVVYTVDFTYDGFTYSMPGEGSIYLSELAEILGLYETDLDKAFSIGNVSNVTFTNYDLVKIERQADGDWLLTSLAPFTSEETLTIEMNDGVKFIIAVTDPPAENQGQGTTDLRSTLDSVTITGNGETFDANGEVTLIKGVRYRIDLSFMESDDNQFVDDDTTMTYVLPADFSFVGATSGTFDMEFGSLGTLKDNPYVIEGNLLKVNWNTGDADMMEILRAADNAHFSVSVWCVFNSDSTTIEWSDEIITNLELEELHNANVSKSGSYNKDTDCIDYVVTVTSEGPTSDVSITDTITGSALTSNVHTIDDIVILKNGEQITVSADSLTVNENENSFVLNLPDMENDDKYEIKYSAKVNYDALGGNGKTKYSETNNTVELDYEENPGPPKESNSYEYEINYSSIHKNFTHVSDVFDGADGKKYRTITWEIEANTEQNTAVDHITDKVRSDSQNIMKMDGTGITVVVTKEDGTTETRTLSWGEDGPDGKLTKNSDYSWTYNPPSSDEKASYKITYTTIAEVTTLTDPVNVNNDVEDGPGHTGSGTVVGPGSEDVTVVKSVAAVSQEEVTWNIDVTIPAEGTTYTRITDFLPQNTEGGYLDIYKSCSVTGLLPEESYKVRFEFGRIEYGAFTPFYEDSSAHDPEDVIGRVYIDFYHEEAGEEVSGLKATGEERNIQVVIVTENQKEWLEAAQDNYWHYYKHTNTAKFGTIVVTSDAEPSLKNIEKRLLSKGTVKLNDGIEYPVYKYEIVLGGVSDDRLEVFDTFDTEVFEILNLADLDPVSYQWNNPFLPEREGHGYIEDRKNSTTKEKVDSHTAQFESTSSGVIISTTGLDRNDSGLLYPNYKINYYLVMKHPEKALEKALAAGGKINFNNAVLWEGAKSDVDVEFGEPVVDKSLVLDERKTPVRAKYTIVINPKNLRLNDGHDMTLKDEFSSTLSIDYTSIRITTVPADKVVTYDYYGNTGVFQIPDETKVTITYECNVIGDVGTVRIYNKATLNDKYSDDKEEFLIIESEGEGGASLIYLDLLKYASENMQAGYLAGAVFRLLDSEKNPVRYTNRAHDPSLIGKEVTFTTESDGVLHIMLSRYKHGITIKKNTVFYLEEIEPPEGYQLDPTLYSFVVSADTSDAEYTREDGVWVYYVGDILKVRNTPETQSLVVTKRFAGNISLTKEQKEKIRFIIEKVDENGDPVTGESAFRKTVEYSKMEYDKFTIKEDTADDNGALTFTDGYYKVTEEYVGGLDSLGLEDNVVAETTYSVNADGNTVIGENVIGADSVTTDKSHVAEGKTTNVIFTNKYSTGAYYFTKLEGGTEEPLEGAVFSVYKEGNDTTAVTHYTTGTDGRFIITRAGDSLSLLNENTLYYVVETEAPEGFTVPDPAPRYYFYFGTEDGEAPEGALENNAINLYEGNAHENVVNISDGSVMVIKKWKKADGSDIPDSELIDKSVTVTLKRKTGTGEEAVVDPDFAKQKTLTIQDEFYGIWDNLEKTDETGSIYYYFVEETDAPEGFVAVYSNNAGIVADGSGEITITNTEETEEGALKLTKEVTVNGAATTGTSADGTYNFTITGPGSSTSSKTVEITVTNGEAASAKIDGAEAQLDADGYVVVEGLTPGVYTITESAPENGTKISKIKGETTEEYSTTVTVAAGDTVSAEATASFTNDYETVDLGVTKAWDPAAPEDAKVTLTLYKGETEAAATTAVDTIELDGTADESAVGVKDVKGATKQEDRAWHAQFTGLPKYEYVAGTDGAAGTVREIFYVVKETSGVSGFNAVYTKADGTTAEYADDGGTVTNTQQKGALKLTKEVTVNGAATTGKSADGGYTFTITGPENVSKTVVITVTNGEAASATIGGTEAQLDADGYVVIGDLVPGEYTITETVPTNGTKISKINGTETTEYSTKVTVVAGDTTAAQAFATFTNNYDETKDLGVTKAWDPAAPRGAKVTLTLYKGETEAAATTVVDTIELDGAADASAADVSGVDGATKQEDTAWHAQFTGLPKYAYVEGTDGEAGTVREIFYVVKETSGVSGFNAVYTKADGTTAEYADDGGTVTNTQQKGALKLTKEVTVNGAATTGKSADGGYTFTITGPENVSKTVVITVTNGEAASATIGGTEAQLDADGYVVIGDLVPGEYTITETVPTNGTKISKINGTATTEYSTTVTVVAGDTAAAQASATFTNNYETTEIEVDKKWVNADESDDWPEGVTVDIQLTADGTEVSGKTATLSAEKPSHKFEKLPKYNSNGNEIEYSVVESNVPGGYSGFAGAVKDGKITITNTQGATQIEVEKKWVNADGTDTWPTGVTVEIQLTADGTEVSGKTATLSAEKPSHKFEDLPMYRADGKTDIEYSVKELKVSGYTSKVGETITGRITVTNTQETTEVVVDKKWVNADGTDTWPTGVTVEIQLTADGTEVSGKTATLSAEKPSHKFEKLPKYNSNGNEIEYSIEEPTKIAGYTSSVEEKEAGKITVTNAYSATGTLNLEAEKKFKNGKLKEGEFTFELMDAAGKVLQSKKNDAAGNVSFDMITYKLADVAKAPFTYTVREVLGSRTDVKYDATVYTVTVELKDKGDGTLEVTKKIDNGGALKFENEQLNVETSVTIGGVKQLKGQTLKKDQFKFVLADENGKWLDTATNDAEGNFTFKPITYKLSDLNGEKTKVYSYSVWEVKGSESGITYDKTVYTVKVTVTDNGDGTMTAKADKAKSDIKFVNTTTEKKSKKTSSSKGSKTGDEAPLGVLFGGLGVGAIGLAVLLWNRKKKKDEE